METRIVYRETIGGGDDKEHTEHGNGIAVTLSHWPSDNIRTQSHYLMQSVVMINREIVVDETSLLIADRWTDDAHHIRQAIARFDQLLDLNPDVDPGLITKQEG